MKRVAALLALLIGVGPTLAQKSITSPESAFGFKLGADRKLADWNQLTAYYKKLSTESDRIHYEELGKTTEGRPFIAVTISAPENIAHLDHYLDIQRRLADPRITSPEEAKKLIAEGKTIIAVTANIHSTEIASSQSVAQFAYELATENTPRIQAILHNVIIVIVPSQNPDGEQLVVDWYKKYLGSPYEGTQPVVIWHHYTGHDDNRDWATFTQVETRLTTEKVLNRWHPEILYDMHQQGSNAARIYLPPFVDPFDPNLDPLLISSINSLGSNTALEISQTGKAGVLSYGVYDFWSPLRDYISLHNGLRILTESASVNIASPINIPFDRLGRGIGYDAKVAAWNFPNPWKGGWWHLSDIVDYQHDAFFSIAYNAAVFRERYLTNFYTIGQHAVTRASGQPYAWIIPAEQTDPVVTARLVNTLRIADVEVQRATAPFTANGQQFSAGSYIVLLGQPFGAFAKSVLEIQHYPDIAEYPGGPLQRPYDVTAQTLPLLFGVNAVEVKDKFEASTEPVKTAKPTPGHIAGQSSTGYLIADKSNSSLYALFALLAQNVKAYRITSGADPGTIYIPAQPGIDAKLSKLAADYSLNIKPANSVPSGNTLAVHLPRIGLYQSWVASMDEGWTRFIFDQNHIPYTRLVDADIRKGGLDQRFDVIVLPDNSARAITVGSRGFGEGESPAAPAGNTGPAGAGGRGEGRGGRRSTASADDGATPPPQTPPEFTGGLGADGVSALEAFTNDGGTIVTFNHASEVYTKKGSAIENGLDSIDRTKFYIPGSILQVSVDPTNPIAFGSTPTVPIFYENGPIFHVNSSAQSIASFDTDNPLLSGWIQGANFLKGNSVIAQQNVGKGHLILFGFRPQYRAISEVTYKFLFNALLYSASKPATINNNAVDEPRSTHEITASKGGE
ncbi:MAG: M14 family zinc carboxypeptidase [Edaphobacter sp.]